MIQRCISEQSYHLVIVTELVTITYIDLLSVCLPQLDHFPSMLIRYHYELTSQYLGAEQRVLKQAKLIYPLRSEYQRRIIVLLVVY